jgi:hypothetical protein
MRLFLSVKTQSLTPAAWVFQAAASVSAFRLRLEVCPALRAAAMLAVHEAQLRWLNFIATFRAGREEGGAYLLGGEFRAAGHVLI